MGSVSYDILFPRLETECRLLQAVLYRNRNQHRHSTAFQRIELCGKVCRQLVEAAHKLVTAGDNLNLKDRYPGNKNQNNSNQNQLQYKVVDGIKVRVRKERTSPLTSTSTSISPDLVEELYNRLHRILQQGASLLSHIEKGILALNRDLEQLYFVNISMIFYSILARHYVCIRSLMQVLHRDYWYQLNELNGKNKKNQTLSAEILHMLFGHQSELIKDYNLHLTNDIINSNLNSNQSNSSSSFSIRKILNQNNESMGRKCGNKSEEEEGDGRDFNDELNNQKVILAGAYSSDESTDSD